MISGAFTSYESDTRAIDFLSNGFKMKDNGTDSSSVNVSGNTHIYYAVAESPLVANVSEVYQLQRDNMASKIKIDNIVPEREHNYYSW